MAKRISDIQRLIKLRLQRRRGRTESGDRVADCSAQQPLPKASENCRRTQASEAAYPHPDIHAVCKQCGRAVIVRELRGDVIHCEFYSRGLCYSCWYGGEQ